MWLHIDLKRCSLGSEVVRAVSSRERKKGDGKLNGKRKSEQEVLRRQTSSSSTSTALPETAGFPFSRRAQFEPVLLKVTKAS